MTRHVPTIPPYNGNNDAAVLRALVQAVGYLMAQQQPSIPRLDPAATTAEVVTKVNAIIDRMQGE